jgi:hypothetical protein
MTQLASNDDSSACGSGSLQSSLSFAISPVRISISTLQLVEDRLNEKKREFEHFPALSLDLAGNLLRASGRE